MEIGWCGVTSQWVPKRSSLQPPDWLVPAVELAPAGADHEASPHRFAALAVVAVASVRIPRAENRIPLGTSEQGFLNGDLFGGPEGVSTGGLGRRAE
ncbi:hypothetical protein GCM10011576_25040 [Micromonospora parathelypteridis]|nr:hypothetical protein GCM10011576_25040 [Micromonospora parathelypteridis]